MKLSVKLLVIPLLLGLTLIQWVGLFLVGFSAVFFDLLAGMIFSVTVVSFFLGLVARMECLNILLVGFAIYIVPHIRG